MTSFDSAPGAPRQDAAVLLTIIALGGVFTLVADSVAGQSGQLSSQFTHALTEIERSLAGAPFHLHAVDLTQLGQQIRDWVTQNSGSLAGRALGGAGVAVEVLTGFVLAGVTGAVVAVPLVAVTWTVWTTLKTRPAQEDEPPGTAMEGAG